MIKRKGRILTGIRPTGALHLGHFIGALKQWLDFQASGDYEIFLLLADAQALTDHAEEPRLIAQSVFDVTLDLLAVGLDPKTCTFHVQTYAPEVFELEHYLACVTPWSWVLRNPTLKSELKQLEEERGATVTAAFVRYPVSQAADILLPKGTLVPVGEDQVPIIELTRDIATAFNRTYGEVFPLPKAYVGEIGRLPGIDGVAKASKSLGNAIILSDSKKVVADKVRRMYTDPGHIHASDPGRIEGNVPFIYLDAFDPDRAGLKDLKRRYQKGGVGDVEIKERLIRVLENFLDPIRARREELARHPEQVYNILREGTGRHRRIAQQTMKEVREAMGIVRFSNKKYSNVKTKLRVLPIS